MKITALRNEIKLSNHCQLRIAQRGISVKAIKHVLTYGDIIYRQGLKFHYMPKSKCKKLEIDKSLVKDLMVITNSNKTEIVTCYKNPKAVHQVKKKSKRLSRTPKYKQHNIFISTQSINPQVA
jgi:hypothetical protein